MYKNLSKVYDKLMDVDYKKYKKIINEELEDKKNLLILDLGCGSGNMLDELKKYGTVTAIDKSLEMLSLAQEKFPNERYLQLDMLDISILDTKFNFILSAFDVLNYLENFLEFEKVLKDVYNLLEKNGKFIFDIHTPKKIENMLAKEVFAYDSDDISYTWFVYETENKLEIESELSFFVLEKDGLYKKIEEYQRQRTYEIEKILSKIAEVGFNIKTYFCDFDKNNKNYNESERIIFILEK